MIMDAEAYKKYHEIYMQNNNGSTALHTFLCIFFTVQCSLFCIITKKCDDFNQYLFEYFVIVLPMILAHTMLSDYIFVMNLIILILLCIKVLRHYPILEITKCLNLKNISTGRINSITCLRALTYLITGLCILAVDFKDFPRYLAKTENYGYSLMDTGVGLFVLMSGLVHKDIDKNNYKSVLKGNIKFVTVLICLGVARFVSVKQLDYQEHITEYGVHWNFFFTLAICKLFSTILLCVFKNKLLLSILILSLHEFLLHIGLQDWVFSDAPRITIVDANREGISSSLGYVFLYLFSAHVKSLITSNVMKKCVLKKFLIYTIVLIMCTYVSDMIKPTSRTLANISYCIYLATLLVSILFILYTIEVIFEYRKGILIFECPLMLLAINNNGLLYFLTSNLTTGFINIVFRTLLLPPLITFIVLNIYMIFNLSVIVYLNKKGIKI